MWRTVMDKMIKVYPDTFAIVSDEDYAIVCKHPWSLSNCGYVQSKSGDTHVLMHRLIMNAKKGQEIDHVNRDKLDNRRDNLKLCTHKDNMKNVVWKSGSSGYRGVTYVKLQRRWRAYTQIDGKQISFGYYATAIEAARGYDRHMLRLFGSEMKHKINFPV